MRLTVRGYVCLFLLFVILGLTSHLWNPVSAGLHDRLKSPAHGQQGGSTGHPSDPK